MKNKLLILSSLVPLILLQACGGGGSETVAVTVTPGGLTPNVNSGSVSAPFKAGDRPAYLAMSGSVRSIGALNPVVQAASGAMKTLGDTVLGDDGVTKDISGDATYAMGRWVFGTVTSKTGSEMLVGNDNRSNHYIVVNTVDEYPASKTLTCASGMFTLPTDVDLNSKAPLGTVSGSANLRFDGGVATIGGTINVSTDAATGSVSLTGTSPAPLKVAVTESYLSGGAGSAMIIGDAGGGAYLMAISYAATLSNGARYLGVAKFRCS